MTRRDEVLEAAIHVTATRGIRGLTHSSVDGQGGLPAGTTSNYFRTRRALTLGTLDRLADRLGAIIAEVGAVPVDSPSAFAEVMGHNLANALGPGRMLGAAAYALYAEATIDESLRDPVERTNRLWWQAIEAQLRQAGVTENVEFRARCILSYANGLAVDQLAINDPDFDAVAAVRLGIEGFCT